MKSSSAAINIEIIATTLQDVIAINHSKASAIELCVGMSLDGITPSLALVKEAVAASALPIRVMVRPRGGNFCYSEEEFRQILETIEALKVLGVQGIVIGMVNREAVDERMKQVMACAKPMKVTFHRAFEQIADKVEAYNFLAAIGVDSILATAIPEVLTLPQKPIKIRLGGGLTAATIQKLRPLGYTNYHFGRAVRSEQSYESPISVAQINNLI